MHPRLHVPRRRIAGYGRGHRRRFSPGPGSKRWVFFYRIMVMGLVLFGSVAALELVWALADLFMGSMALVNLIAIALLAPIALAVLRDYSRQREAGQNPVFHASNVREVKNAECWGESDRVR